LNGVCLWTVDKNRYTTPRDRCLHFSLVLLLGLAAYLFLALKRVYGDRMMRAAAGSLALIVLFLPVLRLPAPAVLCHAENDALERR
jgi:hypothetical protein